MEIFYCYRIQLVFLVWVIFMVFISSAHNHVAIVWCSVVFAGNTYATEHPLTPVFCTTFTFVHC